MAKEMNMDTLVKKLKTVSNTQDSIPMLSIWIIHHKSQHKKIVETWLDMLKKSKNQHRLTLLYLCNDVVQNCARKKAPIYKESFSDVLAEAVTHLRDSSIKGSVQRVVKIWAKRAIFDTDFTDQLLAALITNRAPEKLRNKLLVEYKTTNLIDEIKKFKVIEDGIEFDEKRLKAIRMDVSNSDAIRKLKDKIGGEKFSREFEESATQLETFLKRYESYIEERKNLLDLLDHGTVYYHAQYHEAKIVVNAYKNFESRVNKMKRGVDKVKSKFPPIDGGIRNETNGEDMELSDDDKISEKKSILFSANSKPKKLPEKVAERTNDLPTGEATNVLKLLATGLESLKSTNAAESLKKVMGGLVSRPGMRGASFNNIAETTTSESVKTSLTIVRSVNNDADASKRRSISEDPSPPTGIESPPSPTGSAELNISSPPRLQSLDSRLADLFNEEGGGSEGNRQTGEDSDSGSDTDLIKRANRLLDIKQDKVLPGLGDLDKIKVPFVDENSREPPTAPPANPAPSEQSAVATEAVQSEPQAASIVKESQPQEQLMKPFFFPSANQSIPVIGGLSRTIIPALDGSSTPTLDEAPYSPPAPKTTSFSSHQTTVPTFSGDALSFLTNIMGNPVKPTDATPPPSSSVPSPAVVAPTPVAASPIFAPTLPWPHANAALNSTKMDTNMWSSPPPLPNLPPPPLFSWPSNADPPLPPPWQSAVSTMPPLGQPPPNSVSSVALSFSADAMNPHTSPTAPQQAPAGSNRDENSVPPPKKSKWDVKDTNFRGAVAESPGRAVSDQDNPGSTTVSDKRKNLITISMPTRASAATVKPVETKNTQGSSNLPSPNNETPSGGRSLRDISEVPIRRSNSDNSGDMAMNPSFESNAVKHYDMDGNPIGTQSVEALHRRIEEARINSSLERPRLEHPRRNNAFSDNFRPVRPHFGERENSFRPQMLTPDRRRSVPDRIAITMLEERRREEEFIRDAAILNEIDRMMVPPRPQFRPRFPPHPRLVRPRYPPMRGARLPPRMRY